VVRRAQSRAPTVPRGRTPDLQYGPVIPPRIRGGRAARIALGLALALLAACGSAPPQGGGESGPPQFPTATPAGQVAGESPTRIQRIETELAWLRSNYEGNVIFLDGQTAGQADYVQFVGNVPGKPLLAEAQCAHQPCDATGQASLRQLGYDTSAAPNPRIRAVPGTDHDVAVLVERTFLEALAAPPTYTLCVQRIAPGGSAPGPVVC
jgi:hypothetical protein